MDEHVQERIQQVAVEYCILLLNSAVVEFPNINILIIQPHYVITLIAGTPIQQVQDLEYPVQLDLTLPSNVVVPQTQLEVPSGIEYSNYTAYYEGMHNVDLQLG